MKLIFVKPDFRLLGGVVLENNIFYRTLFNRRFSQDTQTGKAILSILEYMIFKLDIDADTKLTFDVLREYVNQEVPDDDFISAVFYLTRKEPNVRALRQVIEAYDPINKKQVEITPQIFAESIEGGNYIHPITLERIDEKTYSEQVITYFLPTTEFLLSVNQNITA